MWGVCDTNFFGISVPNQPAPIFVGFPIPSIHYVFLLQLSLLVKVFLYCIVLVPYVMVNKDDYKSDDDVLLVVCSFVCSSVACNAHY